MQVTLYYNPRCSKSRQTLALLKDRSIEPVIIDYLEIPPDQATLKDLLSKLGLAPRDLMRKKETIYAERGLDDDDLSEEQLIDAMIRDPILIERPIVVANGKAILGRPPENVLEIL